MSTPPFGIPEDPEFVLGLLADWSRAGLAELHAGLGQVLAARAAEPEPPVRVPRIPGITLRHEAVQCGKKGCTRCPHGPYWYAYWREGNRTHKRYIGKRLPDDPSNLATLRRPA